MSLKNICSPMYKTCWSILEDFNAFQHSKGVNHHSKGVNLVFNAFQLNHMYMLLTLDKHDIYIYIHCSTRLASLQIHETMHIEKPHASTVVHTTMDPPSALPKCIPIDEANGGKSTMSHLANWYHVKCSILSPKKTRLQSKQFMDQYWIYPTLQTHPYTAWYWCYSH